MSAPQPDTSIPGDTPSAPATEFTYREPIDPVVDLSPGQVLRLTPDKIALIDKAMTEANGDRKVAAKYLGVPYIQLSMAVSRHPTLRAVWSPKDESYVEPVTNDNPRLVSRHPPKEVLTSDEQRGLELRKIEDKVVAVGPEKSLSKSLSKLGFRAAEIEKLTTVEEFAGQHFTKTLSLLHGGMVQSAMKLMLMADRIEKTYLMDDGLEEKERNFWWDTYFRIIESLRAMNDQSNKAALTRALVRQKSGFGSGSKPGFSTAIQINVPAKSEVTSASR